jgi:hypothetical protein
MDRLPTDRCGQSFGHPVNPVKKGFTSSSFAIFVISAVENAGLLRVRFVWLVYFVVRK